MGISPRLRDGARSMKWQSISMTSSSAGRGCSTSSRTRAPKSRPRLSTRWEPNWDGTRSDGRANSKGSVESSGRTGDGGRRAVRDSPAIVGIANPRAGNGRARRYARRLDRVLRDANLASAIRYTSAPLEATRLAREAINAGANTLLAIGGEGAGNRVGDGNASEVGPSARGRARA